MECRVPLNSSCWQCLKGQNVTILEPATPALAPANQLTRDESEASPPKVSPNVSPSRHYAFNRHFHHLSISPLTSADYENLSRDDGTLFRDSLASLLSLRRQQETQKELDYEKHVLDAINAVLDQPVPIPRAKPTKEPPRDHYYNGRKWLGIGPNKNGEMLLLWTTGCGTGPTTMRMTNQRTLKREWLRKTNKLSQVTWVTGVYMMTGTHWWPHSHPSLIRIDFSFF